MKKKWAVWAVLCVLTLAFVAPAKASTTSTLAGCTIEAYDQHIEKVFPTNRQPEQCHARCRHEGRIAFQGAWQDWSDQCDRNYPDFLAGWAACQLNAFIRALNHGEAVTAHCIFTMCDLDDDR